MQRLTEKQRAFIREYISNGENATQAYLLVYPNSRKWKKASVRSRAYALLHSEHVANTIQKHLKKEEKRYTIDRDRLIKEEIRIALADPGAIFDDNGELLPIKDWPEDIRRACSGMDIVTSYAKGGEKIIKHKPRFWSKVNHFIQLMFPVWELWHGW